MAFNTQNYTLSSAPGLEVRQPHQGPIPYHCSNISLFFKLQEPDGSWRRCALYCSKDDTSACVIWFEKEQQYEGLNVFPPYTLSCIANELFNGENGVLKDSDGDTIPGRLHHRFVVSPPPPSTSPTVFSPNDFEFTLENSLVSPKEK